MLRVAVPNKGMLAGPAADMLAEAGYLRRHESRDLTVLDPINDIEFFFLRPKDIPSYVGSGDLDLGITGRDQALNTGAQVDELVQLGFAPSTLRYAAPAGREWTVGDLQGKRIATSLSKLVRDDLRSHGVDAEVIRLDGSVEISIQLGLADAIADVVATGRSLRQHNLKPFGDSICVSEAVLVQRKGSVDSKARAQFASRLQGVVFAQQYLMLDYNCPGEMLAAAVALTPGLESPTVSPLAETGWVAVRAMVRRKHVNQIMDGLSEAGAQAILASDIRTSRL